MGTGLGLGGGACGGSAGAWRCAERLTLCSLKVARASKIAGRQFSAAARRKPTGLNVCRNGCAEMHRGGPYWLPPRRAPFGRRAVQPPPGVHAPPIPRPKTGPHTSRASDGRYPFSVAEGREESRDSRVVALSHEARTLRVFSHRGMGHMPRWLSMRGPSGDGGAEACVAVLGARMASGEERRPARSSVFGGSFLTSALAHPS